MKIPTQKELFSRPRTIPLWLKMALKAGFAPPVLTEEEIDDRHKDELVFVFGNGPSLLLAEKYRKQLQNFTSIGISLSYLLINSEYHFFSEPLIWEFCHNQLLALKSTVFYYHKPRKNLVLPCFMPFGNTTNVMEMYWNGKLRVRGVAVSTVNLAYIFGAKKIALLGIDLKSSAHFYSKRRHLYKNLIVTKEKPLWEKRHKRYPRSGLRFKTWKQVGVTLKNLGIEVWNCSPGSALKAFPKIELGNLLKQNKGNKKRVYPGHNKKIEEWLKVAKRFQKEATKKLKVKRVRDAIRTKPKGRKKPWHVS